MATYTNATAMTAALAALKGMEGIDPELLVKFEHMTEQANKAKTSNYKDSAKARAVAKYAEDVARFVCSSDHPVTNREIGENVAGSLNPMGGVSAQKVTCACVKMIKAGYIAKGEKLKGYATYVPAEAGLAKFA